MTALPVRTPTTTHAADALHAARQQPDWNDAALLDTVCGLTVAFTWSGSPGIYARQTLQGVILDLATSRRGDRQLLLKAAELPFPIWVMLHDCQFVHDGVKDALQAAQQAGVKR